MTANQLPDADDRDFALLDSYVAALHSGQQPDREAILADRPELESVLKGLEALERFVPLSPASFSDNDPLGTSPTVPEVEGETVAVIHDRQPPGAELGRFGEYELISEIGRGGMGVVYRARQPSLDRDVAVKMILASHLASPDQVRRFQAEAKAAAAMNHANIVRVFEVGAWHGQHYFTMEFIEGRSLSEILRTSTPAFDDPVRWLTAVARAVHHLHEHGVIHRDLKPSNILLTAEGRPVVTDFGLAKMFVSDSRSTATGMIAGTPSYMSPEQAAGRTSEVGPASDIYSLGAILFELLTGRPPFLEERPLDTLLAVIEREPPTPRQLNPRVPRGLELICLKCLSRSPANRYSSAAELADDLERYLTGEPLLAQPPTTVERLWRWALRKPSLSLRLLGLSAFYAVELVHYHVLEGITMPFHGWVTALTLLWMAGSVICQRLLEHPRWAVLAPFAWAGLDVAILLSMMLAGHGVAGTGVLGFPLLILLAGLWNLRRLVWFTTAAAIVAYLVLVVDFYVVRTDLQRLIDPDPIRHAFFVVALLLAGLVTAVQVSRLRTLSRYHGALHRHDRSSM